MLAVCIRTCIYTIVSMWTSGVPRTTPPIVVYVYCLSFVVPDPSYPPSPILSVIVIVSPPPLPLPLSIPNELDDRTGKPVRVCYTPPLDFLESCTTVLIRPFVHGSCRRNNQASRRNVLPGRCDDDTPKARCERTGPDEDLNCAISRMAVVPAKTRGRLASLEEKAREDGANHSGYALERGGPGVRDVRILWFATCTVYCGVGPDGGEAAALVCM